MPNPFSGNAAVAESVEGRPVEGLDIAVGKQVVRFEPEIIYFRLRGVGAALGRGTLTRDKAPCFNV